MLVCITSIGSRPEDPFEERFGRSPYFLFVDSESGEWTAVRNEAAEAAGGVGPRAAQVLINRGARVLVTGNIGGNALSVVKAAGIEIYLFREKGSAKEAYQKFSEGKLNKFV